MSQSKVKKPDPNRRSKLKLGKQKELTSAQIHQAMQEASKAIDRLSSEVNALKRIVISERAQLIYMTDMAVGYAKREIVDITIKNFSELEPARQEQYVKRAIAELGSDEAIIPHDAKGHKQAGADTAKKGKIELAH